MNYKKIYKDFIIKYRNQSLSEDVYTEKHHIVPRSHGGLDAPENLITLTYRQHKFAHRLLWKAYKNISDFYAYRMMNAISENRRLEIAKISGDYNVISGHLDSIRHLANTPIRQEKLRKLNELKWSSDEWKKTIEASKIALTGVPWSEERKLKHSEILKQSHKNPEIKNKMKKTQAKSAKLKADKAKIRSDLLINNSENNWEYLNLKSKRSKYLYVSPTNLIFESPIFAAKFYGNVKSTDIENWCKRFKYGWKIIPKAETN